MDVLNRIRCEPLTPEQVAEVQRLMHMGTRQAQHHLRLMLGAEARSARHRASCDPAREPEHRAAAGAYDHAVGLLADCWPTAKQPGDPT